MTLQLQAGHYYRTRDGRKAGPLCPYPGDCMKWTGEVEGSGFESWGAQGSSWDDRHREYPVDLVAEWTDSPEWQVTPDGPPDGIDAETMAVPGGIAWRERESEPVTVRIGIWRSRRRTRLTTCITPDNPVIEFGSVRLTFHVRNGQPDTTKPITAEWVR